MPIIVDFDRSLEKQLICDFLVCQVADSYRLHVHVKRILKLALLKKGMSRLDIAFNPGVVRLKHTL